LSVAGDLESHAGIITGVPFEKGSAAFGKIAILIAEQLHMTEVVATVAQSHGQACGLR
jgi:hypothetical protein